MLTRSILRRFSKLPEKPPNQSEKLSNQLKKLSTHLEKLSEFSLIKSTFYKFYNKLFPKMLPRLMRFEWRDLVIYCEVFFVGLMVYIHFVDV